MPQQQTNQQRALGAYLSLLALHTTWQRRLVALAASDAAEPFAFAALALDAAVLWITPDASGLRRANQINLTDFSVDSLSEALRILKNEIRKGLPVSVGVRCEVRDVFVDMVRRGLQPAAYLAPSQQEEGSVLMSRGAIELRQIETAEGLLCDEAQNWRERQARDANLLARFRQGNRKGIDSAEQWLQSAPRLFPRDLGRWCHADWLHETERERNERSPTGQMALGCSLLQNSHTRRARVRSQSD